MQRDWLINKPMESSTTPALRGHTAAPIFCIWVLRIKVKSSYLYGMPFINRALFRHQDVYVCTLVVYGSAIPTPAQDLQLTVRARWCSGQSNGQRRGFFLPISWLVPAANSSGLFYKMTTVISFWLYSHPLSTARPPRPPLPHELPTVCLPS